MTSSCMVFRFHPVNASNGLKTVLRDLELVRNGSRTLGDMIVMLQDPSPPSQE